MYGTCILQGEQKQINYVLIESDKAKKKTRERERERDGRMDR